MKKPLPRPKLPSRRSDNDKRRLHPAPNPTALSWLQSSVTYRGASKHKAVPQTFGLPPFAAQRGDETLCDGHAGFSLSQMAAVPGLLRRGIAAELIGNNDRNGVPSIIWTVADNGWIFEARLTNSGQSEYHGYPVRPSEAIAEPVFRRFEAWALTNGSSSDKAAAANCKGLYGFR